MAALLVWARYVFATELLKIILIHSGAKFKFTAVGQILSSCEQFRQPRRLQTAIPPGHTYSFHTRKINNKLYFHDYKNILYIKDILIFRVDLLSVLEYKVQVVHSERVIRSIPVSPVIPEN